MDFQKKSRLLITCAPGLSQWLRQEIEALGHKVLLTRKTGIEIEGTLAGAMRLNLWLRTAFAVLFMLDEFACRDAEALYRVAVKLPWRKSSQRMSTFPSSRTLTTRRSITRRFPTSSSKTPSLTAS